MDFHSGFPSQQLSYKRKTKKWAEDCVAWGADRHYFDYSPVRKSVVHMKINYDLVNGIIHMDDVARYLNPDHSSALFPPDRIQHYPIMNAYLHNLRGEASARPFDWKVIVTNPNSISEIEEKKKEEWAAAMQSVVEDESLTDSQAQEQTEKLADYYTYEWQDVREMWGNEVLRHYSKEQNFKGQFLDGFMDECAVSTEVYQIGIYGGEPVLYRLNPMKLRAYMSGYSNKIEDADILVYEDYLSPGKIIDRYYDQLTSKNIKWLENPAGVEGVGPVGAAGNYDDSYGIINGAYIVGEEGTWLDGTTADYVFDSLALLPGGVGSELLPYDVNGNIRVTQVFWKSRRKIKMVTHYDQETGDELVDFYPENYIVDETAGETSQDLWVNEPWEGTRIGDHIYVNMRPMVLRFNSLDNPSACHFGIIGTIYNFNESRPFSLVDMMKEYNYLYDATSAKLVELIASNWGKLVVMDLAMKPKDWEVEKWMYFARVNKTLIKDSFNEGNYGASLGKLAGGLNNASSGVVDADWGSSIQFYISLLDSIELKMAKLIGMTPQRMGQIQNRETVGGVERATLQSSYITDYLFQQHDDTIRRVLTAFLEASKMCFRGRTKKFQYILSDGSRKMMAIDGNLYAESDYGLLVDNSDDTKRLESDIKFFAQAAAQRGVMDTSAILRLYQSGSISEKVRMVENAERRMQRRMEQQKQQEVQAEQQMAQINQQFEMQKLQQQDVLNQRDNATKIEVAKINAQAEYMRLGVYADQNDPEFIKENQKIEREKLAEQIREFDAELRQKDKELAQDKEVAMAKIQADKAKKAAKKQ